nr:unnamed protein product [Callosobruchus analis]
MDRLQKRAKDFENDQKYIEEQHIYKTELKNNKEQISDKRYIRQGNGADTCDATTEFEDLLKTEECVRRHSATEVHPVIEPIEPSSSSVAKNAPTIGNLSTTSFEAGPEVPTNTIQRKRKVIIYGDEYARNFRKSLDLYMDNSFQVDAFVKPNTEFSALTKNLFQQVVSLQKDDYFIVMISIKNISNRRSLEKGLSNLIPVSKFTNLIFLCSKNEMGDEILINKINAKINIYKKFNVNCSIYFGCNYGSQLNTKPTRICVDKNGSKSETKIDYFITNLTESFSCDEKVVDLLLGDHFSQIFKFAIKQDSTSEDLKPISISYRHLSTANLEQLKCLLSMETYESIYKIQSIDHQFQQFIHTLLSKVNEVCPLVTKTVKNNLVRKTWVTKAVQDLGEELKKLFWLMKNCVNEMLRTMYKAKKKEYNQTIFAAKKEYYQNMNNGRERHAKRSGP